MMLIDSNILIYAAQPVYVSLRRFIAIHEPAVSAISYVEVLGYHQLQDQDRQYFKAFFDLAHVIPISQAILDQAVSLRQKRKMTLGDAFIASTAVVNNLTLVTCNTEDFHWIQSLSLLNPLDEETPSNQEQ